MAENLNLVVLHDTNRNEDVLPITHEDAVLDANGKSAGVKFVELEQKLEIENDLSSKASFTANGGIIASSGNNFGKVTSFTASQYFYSNYIDISAYKSIRLSGVIYTGTTTLGLVFYNSSYTAIEGHVFDGGASGTASNKEYSYDVPSNAKYIRTSYFDVNSDSSTFYLYGYSEMSDAVKENQKEIAEIKNISSVMDISSQFTLTANGGIVASSTNNSYGNVSSFTGSQYFYSNFVDIHMYAMLHVKGVKYSGNSTTLGLVFYNSSNSPISGFVFNCDSSAASNVYYDVPVPKSAMYVRTSYFDANSDSSTFECIGYDSGAIALEKLNDAINVNWLKWEYGSYRYDFSRQGNMYYAMRSTVQMTDKDITLHVTANNGYYFFLYSTTSYTTYVERRLEYTFNINAGEKWALVIVDSSWTNHLNDDINTVIANSGLKIDYNAPIINDNDLEIAKLRARDGLAQLKLKLHDAALAYKKENSDTRMVSEIEDWLLEKDCVSYRGKLQKIGNYLCDKDGNRIALRGVGLGQIFIYPEIYSVENMLTLKYYGVNCVRITVYLRYPEASMGYLQNKAAYKSVISNIVENAKTAGIYAIINWHSFNVTDGDVTNDSSEQEEFFEYFAELYGSYNNVLWELHNEPFSNTPASLTSSISACSTIIKQYDSNPVLITGVGGNTTNFANMYNALVDAGITDVFVSPHYYLETLHIDTKAEVDSIINSFSGYPIYMTEWGGALASTSNTDPYFNKTICEYWMRKLYDADISANAWVFASRWSPSTLVNYPHSMLAGETRYAANQYYYLGGLTDGVLSEWGRFFFNTTRDLNWRIIE